MVKCLAQKHNTELQPELDLRELKPDSSVLIPGKGGGSVQYTGREGGSGISFWVDEICHICF